MWAQGVWVRTQTGEVCVWRKSLRTCHQPTKSYSVSWTYWCGHCHHKRADLDTRLIITFVLSCIFVFVGVGGSSSCEWPWPFSSYNWLPGCQNVWNDFVTWTVPVCVSSALGERHDTTHVHRRNTAWAVSVCGSGGGECMCFLFWVERTTEPVSQNAWSCPVFGGCLKQPFFLSHLQWVLYFQLCSSVLLSACHWN